VIIPVGRPESKTWWRNVSNDHDVGMLVQGRWVPMTARPVVAADEPNTVGRLLDADLEYLSKASCVLGGTTPRRVPGVP
jgi:hypothetical protein